MPDLFSLRPNEAILREDHVVVAETSSSESGYWGPRAAGNLHAMLMQITTQRVMFRKARKVPLRLRLAVFPFDECAVDLRAITRFETWRPAFSGPPMMIAGEDSWTFDLLEAWQDRKQAGDSVREHFGVLETAWRAVVCSPNVAPS
jgi:hypothetical protein